MFDPASRFSLTEEATMAPGKCFVTGTLVGPFVDLGRDMQFSETGRAYLSIDVIRELAEGAGLFDEDRERSIPTEVAAYQRGYAEGVTDNGDLADLATRLEHIAARIRRGSSNADPILSSGEAEPDPVVIVTDGYTDRRRVEDVDGSDGEYGATAGQGNGARGKRRLAGVSGRSVDGTDSFHI